MYLLTKQILHTAPWRLRKRAEDVHVGLIFFMAGTVATVTFESVLVPSVHIKGTLTASKSSPFPLRHVFLVPKLASLVVRPEVLLETNTKITDAKVNLLLLHATAETFAEKLGRTLDAVGSLGRLGFFLDLLEHWMGLVQQRIVRMFPKD